MSVPAAAAAAAKHMNDGTQKSLKGESARSPRPGFGGYQDPLVSGAAAGGGDAAVLAGAGPGVPEGAAGAAAREAPRAVAGPAVQHPAGHPPAGAARPPLHRPAAFPLLQQLPAGVGPAGEGGRLVKRAQ